MTRLLTTTAVGLLLGLTPAHAQDSIQTDETPPAVQEPAMPTDVPVDPGEPAQPIPDSSLGAQSAPDNPGADDSAEILPETLTSPDETMPEESVTEAPKSVQPGDQDLTDSAMAKHPRFLSKQEPDDWLASNLIGQPVMNANGEAIGDVNDLATDKDGKVIAVIIGAGGFLGIGEKNVAVSYEDLQLDRDENNKVKVVADLSNSMLSTAPNYERLDEQELTVGDNVTVFGADEEPAPDPGIY
jgi:sporulation protein YlmC with PRC-barrel domain